MPAIETLLRALIFTSKMQILSPWIMHKLLSVRRSFKTGFQNCQPERIALLWERLSFHEKRKPRRGTEALSIKLMLANQDRKQREELPCKMREKLLKIDLRVWTDRSVSCWLLAVDINGTRLLQCFKEQCLIFSSMNIKNISFSA